MGRGKSWMVPLTGLAFFVLAIVGFMISGDTPDPGDPAQEIVDFYVDNEGSQVLGAILTALAGTLLVFFGAHLRAILREGEGKGDFLPTVLLAGAIIIAVGLAIDASIIFALTDTAEEIDPAAVQALSALYNNDFVPFAMGSQIFLLALGISVLSGGALPKWIGWIAIALAVIAVTPIGFVSFIGWGILVAIISVMLTMRARATPHSRAQGDALP